MQQVTDVSYVKKLFLSAHDLRCKARNILSHKALIPHLLPKLIYLYNQINWLFYGCSVYKGYDTEKGIEEQAHVYIVILLVSPSVCPSVLILH